MKLEVVVHNYRYARIGLYQPSSLVLNPPRNLHVTYTCFYDPSDAAVATMAAHFLTHEVSLVAWNFRPLDTPQLLRRAIGRNMAARETAADWVWFADCDMAFGPGCLDRLPEVLAAVKGPLAYPRYVMVSRTPEDGDRLVVAAKGPPNVMTFPVENFVRKRYTRAIGGAQLVRGGVAREKGYCPDSRWQRPAARWRRTFEDAAYRRTLGTRGQAVSLPGLYRIRHSECGRFNKGLIL